MADIELVVGEFGDTYDITIYDEETNAPMDLSGFDTITMVIKDSNFASTIIPSFSLSKPAGTTGIARWTITSGQTASISAGSYIAQIIMVDGSVTIRRKTRHLSVIVLEKLD